MRAFVSKWAERPIRAAWGWTRSFSVLAWPGLALGSMAATLALSAWLGLRLGPGLGWALDLVAGLVAGALALLVLGGLAAALRSVLAAWPWRFAFAALGSYGVLAAALLFAGMPLLPSLVLPAVLILLVGGLGGGISALLLSHTTGWSTIAGAVVSILLALGLGGGLTLRLRGPGPEGRFQPPAPRSAEAIPAPDPGAPGLWKTASLTYGSGTDRRRREYGAGAALRTRSVDASSLLPGAAGLQASLRKAYWGFGREALPLNGRVTYPDGKGPFPLVLAVHGGHDPGSASDAGFAYLGELMASRGFIFVSVDENFLNGSRDGGIGGEGAARAWLLLKHLEVWRAWNQEEGGRFQDKVDLGSIGLLGQGRGGEAAALAAAFNRLPCDPGNAALPFTFRFAIKAVAALAPTDGPFEPSGLPSPLEDTSYFVLQGSQDADVPAFEGHRPYKRARFTAPGPGFKAALWIHRANHSRFNTAWRPTDTAPPLSWFLNTGSLLDGEDQRRIAKVFLSGFLEATLHGRREYLPMFRDPATAAAWLPSALFLNQFEDAGFRPVATFDGGLDLTRTSPPGGVLKGENLAVWRQGTLPGRGGRPSQDVAVQLGWSPSPHPAPAYTIELQPQDWNLALTSRLLFSLANADPDTRTPVDLTVELVAGDGTTARIPLSRIRPLPPVQTIRFTPWSLLDRAAFGPSWEPVFQTFELPLALFKEAVPSWSPGELKRIRFVFDRTPKGLLFLDQVGFSA